MRLLTPISRPRELRFGVSKFVYTLFINHAVQVLSYVTLFSKAIVNAMSELGSKYVLQIQIPSLHSYLCDQSSFCRPVS